MNYQLSWTPVGGGGAIHVEGSEMFTCRKCVFANNSVQLGNGGALSLNGPTQISASLLTSNTCTGQSLYTEASGEVRPQSLGGAVVARAPLVASETIFNGNSVHGVASRDTGFPFSYVAAGPGNGGAIALLGPASLTNCTFFLNSAIGGDGIYGYGTNYSPYGHGGAIYVVSNAVVTLTHVSMASNWVGRGTFPDPNSIPIGPAIYVNTNATLDIQASIIGPHSLALSVYGSVTDLGFNLSADATPAFSVGSSANNTDPLFIYPEPTAATLLELQSASPAINRVPLQLTSVDARGFQRPLTGSDSGAIEMEAPFAALTAATSNNSVEFRLGLFGHPLKVEATTDFVTWREVGSTETNSTLEQVFHPSLSGPLRFFRFKEN